MSNNENIKTLIGTFSGKERHIAIPKIYLELVKDFNTAALLNQLVFWSDRSKRSDGYFYKTYSDWEEELTLSKYQVSRSTKKLKELGIVNTKLKKVSGTPVLHYKLDYEALSDWIVKELNNRENKGPDFESKETSQSKVKELNNRKLRNLTMESEETQLSSITVDELSVDDDSIYSEQSQEEIDFNHFWNLYDKKKDKPRAEKAFKKAYKKHGYQKIKEGTELYLQTIEDKQYQKYPATFLSNESFLDIEEFNQDISNRKKQSNKPTTAYYESVKDNYKHLPF